MGGPLQNNMNHPATDQELVRASLRGDAYGFATLARRHWDHVYAVAYSILGRHADAEDVAQETFLRAYTRLGELRSHDRFRAWICRIAWSYAHAHLRRQRRESVVVVEEWMNGQPDLSIGQERYERQQDIHDILLDGLRALPTSLRAPLVMRYMADTPYEAIAERLATSPTAARMRVSRALRCLRDHFTQRGLEEDCVDLLRTHLCVFPITLGYLAELTGSIRHGSVPTQPSVRVTAPLWPSAAVAGVVVALVVLGGLKGSREGHNDTWLVPVDLSSTSTSTSWPRAGVTSGRQPGRESDIPAGARLVLLESYDSLTANEPLPRWSSGVRSQSLEVPPDGGPMAAMVDTNIPTAYLDFPTARGVVTIELWMKPHLGPDANMLLRIGSYAEDSPRPRDLTGIERSRDDEHLSTALLVKNDQDSWYYMSAYHPSQLPRPGGVQVRFARCTGQWSHFRVSYDTRRNLYDLYMDGELVVSEVPSPRDHSAGISYITLNSGRWGYEVDKESYFDELRIYVTPAGLPAS